MRQKQHENEKKNEKTRMRGKKSDNTQRKRDLDES